MTNQIELKQEVLEFLKSNFIMSIAVTDHNKPSASVLLYYVDDELNFYFATHVDSYKSKILKNNPKISLSIWKGHEMLVQVDGIVTIVEEEGRKMETVDRLAEAAGKDDEFWPPLLRIQGNNYIVFKVKPYWMRSMDLKQDTMTQIDSPFVEVKLN